MATLDQEETGAMVIKLGLQMDRTHRDGLAQMRIRLVNHKMDYFASRCMTISKTSLTRVKTMGKAILEHVALRELLSKASSTIVRLLTAVIAAIESDP